MFFRSEVRQQIAKGVNVMRVQIGEQLKNTAIITGTVVMLIVVGHFAIGTARYIKHTMLGIKTGVALTAQTSELEIFTNYEGTDQYFIEAGKGHMQVMPYYHWRAAPLDGQAITIDEHAIRKTVKQPNPGAKKVFMFGGSTTWGTGNPNQYTIASYLQKALGPDYDVYNYGQTAFVSVQELNLLLEQLAQGVVPDIVIFYDGVNDIYASLYSPGNPRHPQFRPEDYQAKEDLRYHLLKIVEKTNYIAITERIKIYTGQDILSLWEKNMAERLDEKILTSVSQYQHLIKQVKALGDAYGFQTFHFWQPMLLTESKPLHPSEQTIIQAESPMLKSLYPKAYQQFKSLETEPNFFYIADVFDNLEDPIYFDFCHMGPKGNELVAARIASHLRKA